MRRLALVLTAIATTASAEVRTATFRSAALGRDVRYVLDLPASYASGDRRYPVVYALHGLFEDASFWEGRGLAALLDEQRKSGAVREFIVVASTAGTRSS
jgi:hypothetical protein